MSYLMAPLAIDLFCGLGGWTEGLLAEGYRVVGFDNERHHYGDARYPAQLVIQDVLTLHGAQFKDAALIVASPPCQAYSYRAMPWKRAKALPPPDNSLFEACFRIQREACAAAGHFIPIVVENVRGAQPWVGRARWHYGSFYLWGDVPALMPITKKAVKSARPNRHGVMAWTTGHLEGYWESNDSTKNDGGSWFNVAHNTTSGKGQNPDGRLRDGIKRPDGGSGSWFVDYAEQKARGTIPLGRMHGNKSRARAAASAHIAKIPLELARHIARAWYPSTVLAAMPAAPSLTAEIR